MINFRKQIRCGIEIAVQCEEVCNNKLNCGVHVCKKVCHSGSCEDCLEEVYQGTNVVWQIPGRFYSCDSSHQSKVPLNLFVMDNIMYLT